MSINRTIASLACIGFLGACAGESAPDFDPSAVPYEPKPTPIEPCGVSLALDPDWSTSATTENDASGNEVFRLRSKLDKAFWEREGLNFDRITVNATADLHVTCSPTNLTSTSRFGLDWVVDRMQKDASAKPDQTVSKVQSFEASGLGTAYYFVTERRRPGGGTATDARMYALNDGILLSVFFTLSGEPNEQFNIRTDAGQFISLRDINTGERYRVRLTAPAFRTSEGVYTGVRTFDQNKRLIEAIFGSLRAL